MPSQGTYDQSHALDVWSSPQLFNVKTDCRFLSSAWLSTRADTCWLLEAAVTENSIQARGTQATPVPFRSPERGAFSQAFTQTIYACFSQMCGGVLCFLFQIKHQSSEPPMPALPFFLQKLGWKSTSLPCIEYTRIYPVFITVPKDRKVFFLLETNKRKDLFEM